MRVRGCECECECEREAKHLRREARGDRRGAIGVGREAWGRLSATPTKPGPGSMRVPTDERLDT